MLIIVFYLFCWMSEFTWEAGREGEGQTVDSPLYPPAMFPTPRTFPTFQGGNAKGEPVAGLPIRLINRQNQTSRLHVHQLMNTILFFRSSAGRALNGCQPHRSPVMLPTRKYQVTQTYLTASDSFDSGCCYTGCSAVGLVRRAPLPWVTSFC